MISRLPDGSSGIAATGSTVTVMPGPRNSSTPRRSVSPYCDVYWPVGTTRSRTRSRRRLDGLVLPHVGNDADDEGQELAQRTAVDLAARERPDELALAPLEPREGGPSPPARTGPAGDGAIPVR